MTKQNKNTAPSIAAGTLHRVLKNGLEIFVCPRPGSGTVFSQAVVRTGSIFEGEFLGCGLSHFLEHMVFAGTEKFPGSTRIADRVNELGGILNASTGYSSTQYYMELPSFAAKDAVDMLYGMVAEPLFPEERFEFEKNVILRECGMRNDRPVSMLFERLMNGMFRRHPVRVPVIGCREKIMEVDRTRMMTYYKQRYAPGRTAFVLAGDVNAEEIADYIEKTASGWLPGRMDEPVVPQDPPQNTARRFDYTYNDPMAWLGFGYREPGTGADDFIANDVFCKLLAGTDSGRLVKELRTRRKLADEIETCQLSGSDFSAGMVLASVAPEKTEAAIDCTRNVIDELSHVPVKPQELERIATGLERAFWDILRKNSGIAQLISSKFAAGETLESLDEYTERVRKVTADDVMKAAAVYHARCRETLVVQMPENFAGKKTLSTNHRSGTHLPVLKKHADGRKDVLYCDPMLPLVEFTFIFPGGARFETRENECAAALLESVWACGTKKHTEEEIQELLDDHAFELEIENTGDSMTIRASSLKTQVSGLVKLLKELFAETVFEKHAFEREREALIHDIESEIASPRPQAVSLARCAIFGPSYPGGFTSEMDIASLKKITIRTVKDFYERMFDPARTIAAAGGALTEREAEAYLEDICSAMQWTKNPMPMPEMPAFRKKKTVRIQQVMKKEQAVVVEAFPSLPMERIGQAETMVYIASNGMSSTLFKTIREERGLAYYTMLSSFSSLHCGWMCYVAGTRSGAEKEVLALFEKERLHRATDGFTQEEFEAAKAQLRFNTMKHLQDPVHLASVCAVKEYQGQGYMRLYRNLEVLETVTREDMNAAAKRLFSGPFFVETVVTPEKISDFPEKKV